MDVNVLLAYAFGLLLIYLLVKLLLVPFRYLFTLVVNGIVGGLILWGLNLVGGFFGLHIAINPFTALTAGFLGVPGVILLIVLTRLLA